MRGHEEDRWVLAVAFSKDSKYLASGSSDNTVIIWLVTDEAITKVIFLFQLYYISYYSLFIYSREELNKIDNFIIVIS